MRDNYGSIFSDMLNPKKSKASELMNELSVRKYSIQNEKAELEI